MSNVKTRPLTRVQAPIQRALGKPTLYRLEDVDELVWEYIRTLRIDEPQFSKPHRAVLETPSLDERAVAYFLQSTMVGMRVTAKAGASSEVLRAIALTALEVLAI
jgi:hypothetical protein